MLCTTRCLQHPPISLEVGDAFPHRWEAELQVLLLPPKAVLGTIPLRAQHLQVGQGWCWEGILAGMGNLSGREAFLDWCPQRRGSSHSFQPDVLGWGAGSLLGPCEGCFTHQSLCTRDGSSSVWLACVRHEDAQAVSSGRHGSIPGQSVPVLLNLSISLPLAPHRYQMKVVSESSWADLGPWVL